MTSLVSLFITMIPIDCKITKFSLPLYIYNYHDFMHLAMFILSPFLHVYVARTTLILDMLTVYWKKMRIYKSLRMIMCGTMKVSINI